MQNLRNVVWFILILFLAISCSTNMVNDANKEKNNFKILSESKIFPIKINGELSKRDSEISGLCQFGNKLLILPQYPNRFGSEIGKIFYIDNYRLKNYINKTDTSIISPKFFTINLDEFEDLFGLGSGFEAITTHGNDIFFTIENMNNGKTETILIKGKIDTLSNSIVLEKKSLTKDKQELFIHNISDESILHYKEKIIPIYEVFGKNININPKVSIFDVNLNFIKQITFPNIEYRITDVTSVDDSGKFWAINYFYPGDNKKLNPAKDDLFSKFGIGKSHYVEEAVERLVEFQILDNSVIFTEKQPIYIELLHKNSRNWEGIERFEDGFIIATDTFPEAILAFVK